MENKNFLGNFVVVVFVSLIALYLVKVFDISYPLTLVSTSKSSELAVVGEGKVEVTPDTAYVDAGITVNQVPSVGEAQKIAKDLGIKLGKITNIVESSPDNPVFYSKSIPISGGGGDVALEAGSQTITSVVTLYFEKK